MKHSEHKKGKEIVQSVAYANGKGGYMKQAAHEARSWAAKKKKKGY